METKAITTVEENARVFEQLGLMRPLALAAGRAVSLMDVVHFHPKCVEPVPTTSEVLYGAMEKESRIFDASISFVDGAPNYMEPTEIRQTLTEYFEKNPGAIPLLGKDPQIEILEGSARKAEKSQRAARIVIIDGIVDGLTPRDIIKLFPEAGIFIENTPEGINISGDHFTLDALQISPLVVHLLTQCRLKEQPNLPPIASDRQPHSRVVQATRTNATNLFIASAKASRDIKGPDSYLYIPEITQPNNRVTPVPVAIENILNTETRQATISDLTNRDKLMDETPIGKAIRRSRLDTLPKGLVGLLYKLGTRLAPVKLLPNVGGLVSVSPPIRWSASSGTVNPDVGNQVKAIGLNLEMFPKSWRVPLVLTVTAVLPTMTGTKLFNTISVTGTEDNLLDEFSERLSTHLRELNG